jgi:hypothetical protein
MHLASIMPEGQHPPRAGREDLDAAKAKAKASSR